MKSTWLVKSFDSALESLRLWLIGQNYSQHAAESICCFAVNHGTPVGCVYLEAEDAVGAAATYIAALPGPVPFEPSAEDLADYGSWSEELDARRRTAAYLDGFNDQRQDWSEVPA